MNDIAILIPFGNGTHWRTKALRHVVDWYRKRPERPHVVVGESDGPWCKAKAVAKALAEVREAKILVIADADCLAPRLTDSINAVRSGSPWAMPHLKVYRMGLQATEKIYTGTEPGTLTGQRIHLDQDPYKGYEGGGVTVLQREIYLDCPLDDAYVGWGQEDESWAMALNALHGAPWRGTAPLYHLWHEKPERQSRRVGSEASALHLAKYKEARQNNTWNDLLEGPRKLAALSVARASLEP